MMEYYSVMKMNETGSFLETWMDLESVIQSEVSQKQNRISYISGFMWNMQKKWY